MPSRHIDSVMAARDRARRTVPRMVFDYIDGGAEDEVTMGENRRAFAEVAFRPRMAAGLVEPRLKTTVLGTDLALPVILAPCGMVSLMHPDGAAGIARAAGAAGTVSVVSAVAGTPLEAVATAAPGSAWFQLYAPGRAACESLIARAEAAHMGALVVTVDTPALGKRERDIRNGVAPPLRINAQTVMKLAPQVLVRPAWAWRMARRRITARERDPKPGAMSASTIGGPGVELNGRRSPRVMDMQVSPFSWADIAWMRERWRGPLVVKGVLSAEDAWRAAESGAEAVVVSNHGGRQLEGAPATLRVLPEVVDAVGDRVEVLVDSGVRRGADVVKALALGARAVLIGRAHLYGLAAGGERGVTRILEILEAEMSRTMALLGCPSVGDLDRTWLQPTAPEPMALSAPS